MLHQFLGLHVGHGGSDLLAGVQQLLARRPDGIFLSDFKQGEVGPDLFRAAC